MKENSRGKFRQKAGRRHTHGRHNKNKEFIQWAFRQKARARLRLLSECPQYIKLIVLIMEPTRAAHPLSV